MEPEPAPALRLAALALLLAGALLLAWPAAAARAADPAACFSIQVGTFANPDNARRYFTRLLAALPPAAAEQLRLERIGSLNVLRLGRATDRQELAPLLDAVRDAVDNPRVMEVDYRPERFLIPPRRGDLTPTPAALPAPFPTAPPAATAPAGGYTVQVATYSEPAAAERAHAELRRALPPEAAALLRLEANDDFYVLRLGQAATREELTPLRDAARSAGEQPRIVAADYRPDRFLIAPGAPTAALASAEPARVEAPPRVKAPHPDAAPAQAGQPPAPAQEQPAPAKAQAATPLRVEAPRPAAPPAVPATGFSVQIGSFAEPKVAEQTHARLRAALPPALAAQLRLEAIGDLMVLRLGQAAAREELSPLLAAARAAGEAPTIVAADYRPERFLISPQGAARPGSASPDGEPTPDWMEALAKHPPGGAAPRPAPFADPEPASAPAPAKPDGPPAFNPPGTPASETARETARSQAGPAPVPAAPGRPAAPTAPAERLPEAVATGYTVQLGSYSSRANALATHARMLAALPPDLAGELRVERVGIYYVLRLGLAPTRGEMLPALERVRTYSPMPVLLAADLDPDRLVVPPRSLGRADAAPALPDAAQNAPAGAAEPEPPALAEPDEPLPPLLPFGSTAREQDLMQARIATRTGQFPQGKKLYEKILAEHPGDEEVLEQYVDALVDEMEYDLAQQLLADWMQRDPQNPRPLRLMGLMFVRAGEHQRAYAPFEDLLERDPGDIGVMADLAFAKLGGGDWRRALELFSTVADEQPENEVAAQAVQELLIAHRPRLASEYATEFRADDAVLATQSNTFSSPLTDRWALDLKYNLVHVDRPSKDTQDRIGHTVQDWMLTTRNLLHENLTAFLGLGAVSGIGERYAQQAGLEWQAHRPGRILVLVERNRPWLDRVDATRYEGFQDHASLAYDALYDDRWGLYLSAERFRYVLLDQEYGRRNVGTGRLIRRLGVKPNLWLGYAYGFGSAEYDDQAPKVLVDDTLILPVGMDREEESHSWFLTTDDPLGRYLRLALTGGGGVNTISGNAFFFGSGEVRVEVNNRLTVRTGLGYNSDKSNVGGETTTFTVGILWIF